MTRAVELSLLPLAESPLLLIIHTKLKQEMPSMQTTTPTVLPMVGMDSSRLTEETDSGGATTRASNQNAGK